MIDNSKRTFVRFDAFGMHEVLDPAMCNLVTGGGAELNLQCVRPIGPIKPLEPIGPIYPSDVITINANCPDSSSGSIITVNAVCG